MIKCNKCGVEKEDTEYYPRNRVCKSCTKKRVSEYQKTEKGKQVKRQAAKNYYATEAGRQAQARSDKRYKAKPTTQKKVRAKEAIKRAVRRGDIVRQPCEICGSTAVAHHDDYDKPLDVRWLCPSHHKQWHTEHGEGANASNG